MGYMDKSITEIHEALKNKKVTVKELIDESLEKSHKLQDEPNLREVQAFPCNASGQDTMMGAPSVLDDKQLEELGIKIDKED